MASSPAHPREQHVGVADFTKPIRNISIPFANTSSTTTAQSSHSGRLTFSRCHQRNYPCISISGSCSCIAVHNDNSVADNIADINVLIRNVSNYDAVHVFDGNCCVASNTDGLSELHVELQDCSSDHVATVRCVLKFREASFSTFATSSKFVSFEHTPIRAFFAAARSRSSIDPFTARHDPGMPISKMLQTMVSNWFPIGLFIFAHSWIVTSSI